MMTLSIAQPISVLLDKHAHHYAQRFASEQINPQKSKQVYLNTLAVYAVHHYCQWLSIPHNLEQGDCWHSGLRAMFNVADLVLTNIGKVECLPLLPSQQIVVIPPEASSDRIGYMGVQFGENLDQVHLLGFIKAKTIGDPLQPIPISQLQPLDDFIDTVHHYQCLVNLREWFEGIFTPEWQPIALSFRSVQNENDTISRSKLIQWENSELTIMLVVRVKESSFEEIDISLQIYPDRQADHLPPQLQVTLFDETGTPALDAKTQQADNLIQLDFTCHPSEQFTLTITLGDNSITELFSV